MGDLGSLKYMLPWANPSPQPKWHLNRFSRFRTVHVRVSSGMLGHAVPEPKTQMASRFSRFCTDDHRVSLSFTIFALPSSKLSLLMGGCGPYLIRGSLGPLQSSTQTESPLVEPFFLKVSLLWQTDRRTSLCSTAMRLINTSRHEKKLFTNFYTN